MLKTHQGVLSIKTHQAVSETVYHSPVSRLPPSGGKVSMLCIQAPATPAWPMHSRVCWEAEILPSGLRRSFETEKQSR